VKVIVRGLEIEVQSFDELDELIRRYSGSDALTMPATPAVLAKPATAEVAETTKARLPSRSKREAMLKLYKGLRASLHRDIMRVLASKEGHPVETEEVRKDLNLHATFKMSGFTAMVRRRAPSYGLDPDEVLIVEFRGTVAGQRLYLYALGPEMLSVLKEEGLIQGKPH
jgi:hypothetical protein